MGVDKHEERQRNGEDDPNPARKAALPTSWTRSKWRESRGRAIASYYKRKAAEKKYEKEYLTNGT